tara:strand:+ start:2593 stop:3138 length:546 start_codon:yes stop_codon:yes gene_type:complete
MVNIRKSKYKVVKNFFTKEELKLLQLYCRHQLDKPWVTDAQTSRNITRNVTPYWYEDSLMTSLLELKLPKVEEEVNLKLFKTYAFWRYYIYGSVLEDHTDRPSCEISVTSCIHKTGKWPIHMGGKWIELEEGDAVIYLGCEIPHGRKKFKSDGCAQVFFHYVDQKGPYTQYRDDTPAKEDR